VGLGSHVTLRDSEEDEYEWTIVGSAEANPRQMRISNESPVGQALMGHKAGDKVHVNAPAGVQTYTIMRVE
jgi:transcription elongation factor GreA